MVGDKVGDDVGGWFKKVVFFSEELWVVCC